MVGREEPKENNEHGLIIGFYDKNLYYLPTQLVIIKKNRKIMENKWFYK